MFCLVFIKGFLKFAIALRLYNIYTLAQDKVGIKEIFAFDLKMFQSYFYWELFRF